MIEEGANARSVALIGFDYIGMKPTMEVAEGDQVALGQLLFTDKKTSGVKYTSPGAGRVSAINRGEKRALQSVVIELEGDDQISFDKVPSSELSSLDNQQVRDRLIDSGLWTAFRTRPFSKVPAPKVEPAAIFVTAMDSNPLAADPQIVINAQAEQFKNGLKVLARLGAANVFCCVADGADIDVGDSGARRMRLEDDDRP